MISHILPLSRLNRRIIYEMLRNFALCACFMLALVLIGRGVQMRELFLNLNIGVLDAATILLYMSPIFLLIVVPLSCMLSVFLTFLRMSTDRELVAMKAGGVSILQVLPAPAAFSVFCFALTLLLSLYGISWGTEHFRDTVLFLAKTKAQLNIQPGVFNQDIAGLTLYARKVDPQSGELTQVIFEDTTSRATKDSRFTILAPKGEITTDNARGELVFNLRDGRIYRLDHGNVSVLNFATYTVSVSLDKLFDERDLKGIGEDRPKELSWSKLVQYRTNPPEKRIGDDHFQDQIAVELQKRWSLPAACLVLGLFAVPLACSFEGAKKQTGIVLALIAFLLFYSLYSTGVALAESGYINPVLAMWLPNALFFALGLLGMYLTYKEREPELFPRLKGIFSPLRNFFRNRSDSRTGHKLRRKARRKQAARCRMGLDGDLCEFISEKENASTLNGKAAPSGVPNSENGTHDEPRGPGKPGATPDEAFGAAFKKAPRYTSGKKARKRNGTGGAR